MKSITAVLILVVCALSVAKSHALTMNGSRFVYAGNGHASSCNEPSVACSSMSFTWSGDTFGGSYSGGQCYIVLNGGTTTGKYNKYSCTYEVNTCQEKANTGFQTTLSFDDGVDEEGCYFSCYEQFDEENNSVRQCRYNGESGLDDPQDGDYDNIDTDAPEYCNNTNSDGSCVDFDHPDNDGGCKANGKVYGTVSGVTGCFYARPDYEPEDYAEDKDNDNIPDHLDDDRDGDGIPNDKDATPDGPDGPTKYPDKDGDGIRDYYDDDEDGDGIPNGEDSDNGEPSTDDGKGDQKEDPKGSATDCSSPPLSQGDAQLAAIHRQLWINECQSNQDYQASEGPGTGEDGRGSWYTSEYPDGLDGIWAGVQSDISDGAIGAWLGTFQIAQGGSCPSFNMSFDLGFSNFGSGELISSDWCWIWDVIGAIVMLSAVFMARSLIFGG